MASRLFFALLVLKIRWYYQFRLKQIQLIGNLAIDKIINILNMEDAQCASFY